MEKKRRVHILQLVAGLGGGQFNYEKVGRQGFWERDDSPTLFPKGENADILV